MNARISTARRQQLVAADAVGRTVAFMERFVSAEQFPFVLGCLVLNLLVDDPATACSVQGVSCAGPSPACQRISLTPWPCTFQGF